MKVILRNLETGCYFQYGATWTAHAGQAKVYADIESALEAAYDSSMAHLEMNVLLFDDSRYTVRLALDKFFSNSTCERPRVRPNAVQRIICR